jgi:ribosomal-protein-alanine N-acetyltransferase
LAEATEDERTVIGRSDGTGLEIRPLASDDEAVWAAKVMAASEPWITLGRDEAASRAILKDAEKERYILLEGGERAGFLILNMRGALAGYIQTICVAPAFRGRGLGTRLMAFAEERVLRQTPNVFLCVSSFNEGARRLYERLGYVRVGDLPDFLVAGHSETLMRKSVGPLTGFQPR